jgi:C1A family cysteine protease
MLSVSRLLEMFKLNHGVVWAHQNVGQEKMTDLNKYHCGALRSPIDVRDRVADVIYRARGVTDLPDTLDLRSHLPPVREQGSRESCSAFVGAAMKEWQERRDTGYTKHFSPEYIYMNRENFPTDGMYGRDVMDILLKLGCPTEELCPYRSPLDATKEFSNNVVQAATRYRIKSYAAVGTIDGLKQALFTDGPCYIALPIFNYGPKLWLPETPNQGEIGGHALTVVGYNKNGFILRNSWGAGWNGNGHTVLPYADFGLHFEVFTSIDLDGSPDPTQFNPVPDPKKDDDKKKKKKKDDDKDDDKKKFLCIPLPW